MAAKKKKAKKPAKPKSLVAAENRVNALQKQMQSLQSKVDSLKRITGNRKESAEARAARNKALQELQPLQQQLEQKGQALQNAFQSYSTIAGRYSNQLANSGFTKAAQRFQRQAQNLGQSAQDVAGTDFVNQYTAGGSPGEQIQQIAGGGIGGLAGVVNQALPAATQAGQGIVGMNLSEANTALLGGGGQQGIVDLANQIATGQQAANTAAQQQQFQDFQNLAPDFRAGMQAIAPEMVRAGDLANKDVNRMNRLERGTFQDTRQSLNQQQRLATKAVSQATNYQDPTRRQVRQAGRQMFGAARKADKLANKATSQAMNYVDPTAELAQSAISGFQGLTGLQQQAAEDAYARSGQLSAQQNRDAQQAAREAFAARGMADSTGSVAAEILNREASLANRRAEAAQMGQIAQQGQAGLTGLASGYESDRLARRTGLQQSAAGLQGIAGQMYGNAGQFTTSAESEARRRQIAMQQNAMGLSQNSLMSQMGVRGEAGQARQNLANIGQSYLNYGLPLMTNQTGAQQYAGGLVGLGLGMSGQGSGLLQAGTNLGMGQYANNLEYWNAKQAADSAKDAGKMGLIGAGIGALGTAAGGWLGRK